MLFDFTPTELPIPEAKVREWFREYAKETGITMMVRSRMQGFHAWMERKTGRQIQMGEGMGLMTQMCFLCLGPTDVVEAKLTWL